MNERDASIIEAALRKGAKLHAFMSGGGLRVVRLERGGALVGYGEAPEIVEALQHVAEDFAAGGRPYSEVYGKLHTHYLTGQSSPSCPLDAWIRQGRTFDAVASGDGFTVELCGLGETRTPKDVTARAVAGETVVWESRGYTYESRPSRFPNGEACVCTSVIKSPPGKRSGAAPWMYDIKQTSTAPTLTVSIDAALAAEAVEVAP